MPKCPKCGKENSEQVREWVGGAETSKPMKVQRFVCFACGTSFASWTDSKTGEVRTMTR